MKESIDSASNISIELAVTFYVLGFMAVSLILFILYKKHKSKGNNKINKKVEDNKLYDFLIKFPLTTKYIFKINKTIIGAGIYSDNDIRLQTIKYAKRGIAAYVVIFFVSLLLYRDILTVIVLTSFGYIVSDLMVMTHLKKESIKMLDDISEYLAMIAQGYTQYNSAREAVNLVAPPKRLETQVKRIREILNSDNKSEALSNYHQTAPVKILYTLAEMCVLVSDIGDTQLPNGKSNFATSLTIMTMDINIERSTQLKLHLTFKNIRFLTLIPVFSIWLIKYGVSMVIPGLSVVLIGKYGYVSTLVLLIYSVMCYRKIDKATDIEAINENDVPEYVEELYAKKKIRDNIKLFIPTRQSTVIKIEKLINESRSRHNIKTLYIQKITNFLIVFLISFLLITIGTLYGKDFLKAYDKSFGFTATDEYEESIKREISQNDDLFVMQKGMTEDELYNSLKSIKGLDDMEVEEEFKRIIEKKKKIDGEGLGLTDVILSLAIALYAFRVPNAQLKTRSKIIKAESDSDIMQMLTLISMYMHTTIDTQEVIKRLAKASKVYKSILFEASNYYIYNKDYAFALLNSKCTDLELRKIIFKLKATYHGQSLAEAFQSLEIERDDILKRKETFINNSIEEKKWMLSPIANRPLYGLIILFIVGPLAIFAFTGLKGMFDLGLF